jgi:hypothetical protein
MSDPYRASVCGECGRPHDPPAVCRRCGDRPSAPLLGRPACALCALRVAPALIARALVAFAGFAFRCLLLVSTLGIGVLLGALWIPELARSRDHVLLDPMKHVHIVVEIALVDLDAEIHQATPPPPPVVPAPPLALDAGACSRDLPASAVPHVLSALGPPTIDPRVLLARASRLAAAGFELTIARTDLASGVFERALVASTGNPPSVVPVRLNGGAAGVCIEGVGRSGVPRVAGLQSGDVITSINGIPIVTPELGLEAYESARRAGLAVLEILRGEHRVVLAVTFPELTRGARARAGASP